ncbi:integration host factor subunit alpha [Acidithiobacillus sp.]|uniref:integration host factor subunit alpha n=1 Tax=Acidithiobacillus sp. TaxID=1872118 RepID=UPI003D00D87B
MTITKQELTYHLVDTMELTAKDCKAMVEAMFDVIRATLASGEEIKLSGFGNFMLREKRARPGRNPRNGKPFEIGVRRVATFRAGMRLRAKCAAS